MQSEEQAREHGAGIHHESEIRDSPPVYLNGAIVAPVEATISVFDAGFGYGDGVFEGVRVYDGRVFRLDEHLARLSRSARALGIAPPMDLARLRQEIVRWLRVVDLPSLHFRIMLTRGMRWPSRLDPAFTVGSPTLVFVVTTHMPRGDMGSPLSMMFSSLRRPPPDVLDPKVKSLNYLNNVLARGEARSAGADDAFLLDTRGFLAEATGANAFIVNGQELSTPHTLACLEGITRAAVIRLAAEAGFDVHERDISMAEVITADEVFLAGTAAEIRPVSHVMGHPIGADAPGPVTSSIASLYADLIDQEGENVW